ncbi:hemolysin III family protein [Bacteroides sp. OttesenSCG-928-E20]|nr:hemolysin III family protein [Bacteroides sp. OttesenSCG-928-N06]MDL2299307.1 hemolysin III family protein [Bacteroides sp. OttesenSCG-928-E20]
MIKRYTLGEELANAISHGVAIVLGLVAGWILLEKASANAHPYATTCVWVYLIGMLSSYTASTWYHAAPPGNGKELLRKFDHAAIYLHIAGTYTPFTLLAMADAGAWGWGIFTFNWLAAIVGIILSFTNLKEHSNLETACFIGMGCSITIAIKPLWECLSATDSVSAIWWLIAGGVSYILGAGFYSWRKIKYMHSIFHLFCLGGTICHLMAIWLIL